MVILVTKGDLALSSRVNYIRGRGSASQSMYCKKSDALIVSDSALTEPREGAKLSKLNPNYISGFVDGKGIQKFRKLQERMRQSGKRQ